MNNHKVGRFFETQCSVFYRRTVQVGHALRCPAAKFITHTLSHLCFLILLAAATFRLDEKAYPISYNTSEVLHYRYSTEDQYDNEVNIMLKATFRPENVLMTRVQICLMFWILGNSRCYLLTTVGLKF